MHSKTFRFMPTADPDRAEVLCVPAANCIGESGFARLNLELAVIFSSYFCHTQVSNEIAFSARIAS
jgi:hypothetical protein